MRPLDFFYMGLLASLGPARKSGEMAGRNKNRSEKPNRPAIKNKSAFVFFEMAADGKLTIKFACP